ncbi:DUF3237 domain-containing protein [Acuticoccus sp. I52.16.1]|uniref:DUF3237 domain-containing protein n=1 Tax=Acuticoccus sp. I52.16.1 TaxID=2928472 RepID=UPI001FD3A4EB|nr:DUF3237 domain-containing protein [Acuticoccus sp. I52.16.1]UOM34927.1 DUF3237 domain-containing protein [Acuticoccus sp. I52.16.1]
MIDPPRLAHLVDLRVELGPPMELGSGRAGRRRIIPILGGTVTGRITGRIANHGADWQTVFDDGLAELDTRYLVETDDGALIEIRNFGYRHGSPEVLARLAAGENVDAAQYYMRTHPRFETGAPRYAWLNRTICIGTGAREAAAVRMHVFEVL